MKVAVEPSTEVAAFVVTVGAPGVVKDSNVPGVVPIAFEASAQKKYVVPAVRPVIGSENATAALPLPSDVPAIDTRVPKVSLQTPGLVVEYRNQPVPALPRGFAEPLSVAVVPVTSVAADVVTAGAAEVVKLRTVPKRVPAEFEAIAQT